MDNGTDEMLTSRSLITMIFPLLFNDLITRKNIVFLDKQQGIFFCKANYLKDNSCYETLCLPNQSIKGILDMFNVPFKSYLSAC